MSAQENVELVKQGYAAFGSGDMEKLLSLFAEDIKWRVPTIEGAPFGGEYDGREQVAAFFGSLAAAEDIQEFTQEDYIAQDDRVVVTGRSKAVVRATGRTLEMEYVHLFTVRAGKVQQFVEHFDTAAAADAYRQAARAGV